MSHQKTAICPSCHQSGQFRFNGNQRWPAEVAARLGMPTVIGLWTCPACHTTVSEMDLQSGDQEPLASRTARANRQTLTIVTVQAAAHPCIRPRQPNRRA